MTDVTAISSGTSTSTSTSSSSGSLGGLADDFSTFLTLLTTQLQNQDPLDPTDTNEFTNQLVAFSQVEQQIRSNDQLEGIADQLSQSNLAAKAGFLGQMARVEHDTGIHDGEGLTFLYQLNDTPASTDLRVVDGTGNTVFSLNGEVREGLHTFEWSGIQDDGTMAPAGTYSLVVDSRTADNDRVPTNIFVEDEIIELDGGTGDLIIADRIFGQNELLRVVANGI